MTSQAYRDGYAEIDWRPLPRTVTHQEPPRARSSLPAPMVLRDQLDAPVQSMANGEWHTTKSGLRATYLPSGNPEGIRYTEVGNDPARFRKKQRRGSDRKAIRDTVERAFARYDRGERVK